MSELSDLRLRVEIQEGSLAQAARELAEAKSLRRRIEALHHPDSTGDWCNNCCTGWPCATIRALQEPS